jgi:CRP/FNR family cyclic AMP-dependent transcriptional regulator
METEEAWESIRRGEVRSLKSLCGIRSTRRFRRKPYECWTGDVAGHLAAALLPFAVSAEYRSRSILFMEGQEPGGLWLVCTGQVRLTRSSAEGKTIALHSAHPGATLGLSAVLAQDLLRMEAQVDGACTLAFLETKNLFRLMAESPGVAQLVAEALGREVQGIYSGMGDLMLTRSAKGRLARILLSLADGDHVTHVRLAELANCSRETVTRQLGLLRRDGTISYDRGAIQVLNRARLEAMCE